MARCVFCLKQFNNRLGLWLHHAAKRRRCRLSDLTCVGSATCPPVSTQMLRAALDAGQCIYCSDPFPDEKAVLRHLRGGNCVLYNRYAATIYYGMEIVHPTLPQSTSFIASMEECAAVGVCEPT